VIACPRYKCLSKLATTYWSVKNTVHSDTNKLEKVTTQYQRTSFTVRVVSVKFTSYLQLYIP
jgi:hypothetical protein